jgi:hypothetical protein
MIDRLVIHHGMKPYAAVHETLLLVFDWPHLGECIGKILPIAIDRVKLKTAFAGMGSSWHHCHRSESIRIECSASEVF